MPYLIYAIDHPGMEQKRENHRQAHRDFLKSHGAKILASGALLDENGTIIGGISLFDTNDLAEATHFAHEDPYAKAGIRAQTLIHRWRKRWWDGHFLNGHLE